MKKSLTRRLLCFMQACPFVTQSDEGAVWGQCVYCEKRAGYVTRKDLRSHIDRELAARGPK